MNTKRKRDELNNLVKQVHLKKVAGSELTTTITTRNELSFECQLHSYKDHASTEQPMMVVHPFIRQPIRSQRWNKKEKGERENSSTTQIQVTQVITGLEHGADLFLLINVIFLPEKNKTKIILCMC